MHHTLSFAQPCALTALGTALISLLLVNCGSADPQSSSSGAGGSGQQTTNTGATAATTPGGAGNTGPSNGTGSGANPSGSMQVNDVITLAGELDQVDQDNEDGPGRLGQLASPMDFAADDAHLYLLESSPGARIRVLDRVSGIVTTLAGSGKAGASDGLGVAAEFGTAYGMAIDPSHRNLYVADSGSAAVRRVEIATGQVTTIAGALRSFGNVDGVGVSARFKDVWGIVVDSRGEHLYVTDDSNDAIRVVNLANAEVTTLAGSTHGNVDGIGANASFNAPKGLAIDSDDAKLYVVDGGTDQIRVVDIASRQVTTLGTTIAKTDGFSVASQMMHLWSVTVDPTSTFLYTTEGVGTGSMVRQIELATGTVKIIAGWLASTGYRDALEGTQALLNTPRGLRVMDNAVYVADSGNDAIRRITIADHSVATYAGGPYPAYFAQPFDVVNDGKYLYVTDAGYSEIRKVSMSNGSTTTIAGTRLTGYSDGIGSAASFNAPMGIALGGSHLYIADYDNHAVRVLDLSSNQVTTLAGTSSKAGATDGIGAAATFDAPAGIAVDHAEHSLYVSDRGNHEIRKIDIASGQVTTLAGSSASGFVDGLGNAASLKTPAGIVLDPTGAMLYVADSGNHAIRKVDVTTGAVSTFAGTGTAGSADGVGTAATFNAPLGLATDGTWLYVADSKNNEIRRIEIASARVTTVYGGLTRGSNDGLGTSAGFDMPIGLSLDATATSLYVCDSFNSTIRKIRLE